MSPNIESRIENLEKFSYDLSKFYKMNIENELLTAKNKKLNTIEQELLILLDWNKELSVKEVIELLKVPNSTITSTINRLELQNILTRSIHPDDRRTFILNLTQEGRELVNIKQNEKKQLFYYLLNSLESEDEQILLIDLIKKISHSLNVVDDNLLRRINMDILQKEYNAFGPWLTEIKDESEVPPQFASKAEIILNAEFALKVPINIERRQAKPGMLLYNHVIALYPTCLRLFNIIEGKVDTVSIEYDDIQFIQVINDLLFGQLIITANNKDYSFNYNPVPDNLATEIVESIRSKYYLKEATFDIDSIKEHEEVENPLFRNLIINESKNDKIKLIEYQPFLELEEQKKSVLNTLVSFNDKPVLQDSLFMTNGKELIILSRLKEVKQEKDVDFGYKRTYIPLAYINDVLVADDDSINEIRNLEFHIDQSKFLVKVGNEIDVDRIRKVVR